MIAGVKREKFHAEENTVVSCIASARWRDFRGGTAACPSREWLSIGSWGLLYGRCAYLYSGGGVLGPSNRCPGPADVTWRLTVVTCFAAAGALSAPAAASRRADASSHRGDGATSRQIAQSPSWPRPRRAAAVTARALWSLNADGMLNVAEFPLGIKFAKQGLIVYDQAVPRLVILDGANGRVRFTAGRRGSGPGEFTGKPVAISGTWSAPFTVEFGTGRVMALVDRQLKKIEVADQLWTGFGCSLGSDGLLLQKGGAGAYDLYVVRPGSRGEIEDSVAYPWARSISPWLVVRQTRQIQLGEDGCLLLPWYSDDIGIIQWKRAPLVRRQIEPYPEAQADVQAAGKSRRIGLALGTKPAAIAASPWRDKILVLFRGRTDRHHRIIDIYSRGNLAYQGSLLLPTVASDISVSGDTLAVLAEVEDEPVLNVYLLAEVVLQKGRPQER